MLSYSSALAQLDPENQNRFDVTLSPKIGYGHSDIGYSIAGNEQGTNPNILSELKWADLRAIQYGLDLYGNLQNRFVFKAQYMRINVFDGAVSDIDYADDNRRGIFSEQYLSSHNGFGSHVNAQVGYKLIDRPILSVSFLLGVDHLHQRAYLLNHKGDNIDNNPLGYFEGLHSYYSTNWKSIGINLWTEYRRYRRLSIRLDVGAYKSTYHAYGNWNLIPYFAHPKSYTHEGKGIRMIGNLMISYKLSRKFHLNFGYMYSYATVNNGIDRLYLTDGSTNITRLNEVRQSSHYTYTGFAYVINKM